MTNYIRTIQELVKSPRNVIDSFLFSEKSVYTHPFLNLVLSILISVLVLSIGYLIADFPSNQISEISPEEVQLLIGEWIAVADFRAFTQFLPVLMACLLIFCLSIAGNFFFREQLDSFYKNIILNSYSLSVVFLAQILLIPFWLIFPEEIIVNPNIYRYLPAIITGLVLGRTYYQYFRPTTPIMWIRIASVIASGYLFFVLIGGFVNSVIGYMLFAINRILELAV